MRTLSPYKYVTGSSEFELPFFDEIFVKFLPKPRTDGKKVSFYKWRGYQEKVMFMYWKMAIPMGSKENSAEKFVKIIPETVYWGEKSVLL